MYKGFTVLFVLLTWVTSCRRNNDNYQAHILETTAVEVDTVIVLPDDTSTAKIDMQLREVNDKFSFAGEPINPRIIERFQPWLSDGLPLTITIDIAAAWHTDEFYIEKDSTRKYNTCTSVEYGKDVPAGYFCYSYIGKLDSNIHVVQTSSGGGGGTMVSIGLLFFKFTKAIGSHTDGSKYDQLLMHLVREATLCDRCTPNYTFKGNKLIVDIKPRPTCDECKPERKVIAF